MHSHIQGGREGKEKKSGRTNGALTFISAKEPREKKAAAACAVIQCVRKREKNGFIAKMALFDGGGQTDRTGIMPGP